MQRVLELAGRAKGLSQQILSFGRQNKEEDFATVSLTPLVLEAVSMIRALVPATVDIRTDIHGDPCHVKCDAAQMQQLIVNLCTNAVKAMQGKGHITVTVAGENVSAERAKRLSNLHEGAYAILKVTDTGSSMDRATAQRIFEPFFTTNAVGEGSGLGLSVVHGIVMRHGGSIGLESKPGEGTTFTIYLPMVPGQEQGMQQTG